MTDDDLTFRALADGSRRTLLDRLHQSDGQTLGQLCQHLAMTRQSVSQHLGILEEADLVVVRRSGREKLHFLNPVPLQSLYTRWIGKFERPRLEALEGLKKSLEEGSP
jgi:DNA-binding transcriptional ArsR family regulator